MPVTLAEPLATRLPTETTVVVADTDADDLLTRLPLLVTVVVEVIVVEPLAPTVTAADSDTLL
jgi:hypothetical protein